MNDDDFSLRLNRMNAQVARAIVEQARLYVAMLGAPKRTGQLRHSLYSHHWHIDIRPPAPRGAEVVIDGKVIGYVKRSVRTGPDSTVLDVLLTNPDEIEEAARKVIEGES